jgi:GNAT superfamily N-acetyltransferase
VDPRRQRTAWATIAFQQRACYARYGASNASADYDPFSGRVFALAVVDPDGVPVAGARIHVRDDAHPLPIERHFQNQPLLRAELECRMPRGVGEVGGLWACRELAGTGIGADIVAAAAAYAPLLGVRHLVAFTHHHHRFSDAVGFRRDERFPEKAYPDERYRSVVRWCDTRTLDTAAWTVRGAILQQRLAIRHGERIRLYVAAATEGMAAVGA